MIYCDNQDAITYTRDPKFHSRTKHIDSKYHYVRDIIEKNEVTIKYISTHNMVANPLTKPISRDSFMGQRVIECVLYNMSQFVLT